MLNSTKINFILICLLFCTSNAKSKHGIIQKDRGERLGDRLLIICAVKFLALTHNNLNFYYMPSTFLDNYGLSKTETKIDDSIKARYKKQVTFSESSYEKTRDTTLFLAPWDAIDNLCNYFGKRDVYRTYFDQLQAMVTPLISLPQLDSPSDAISVAVHIRTGEGYDNPLLSAHIYKNVDTIFWGDAPKKPSRGAPADRTWPIKFPPEQYFIDQIKVLEDLLPDKKMIFYIFSDSLNPQALTERVTQYCSTKNTAFINAASPKSESPMVDMYKMATCDCLIRPDSSYSIVSQIMGNHKIVFSPQNYQWRDNILYITRVRLTFFDNVKNKAWECTFERCDQNILRQWVAALFA